jgi:hypothetical protein
MVGRVLMVIRLIYNNDSTERRYLRRMDGGICGPTYTPILLSQVVFSVDSIIEDKVGCFSGVKALLEVPTPLIFVSFLGGGLASK